MEPKALRGGSVYSTMKKTMEKTDNIVESGEMNEENLGLAAQAYLKELYNDVMT